MQGRGDVGSDGGEAANQCLRRGKSFEWQRAADGALPTLEAENRLRRLTGLDASDGQLLYPINPPHISQLVPDWEGAVNTASATASSCGSSSFAFTASASSARPPAVSRIRSSTWWPAPNSTARAKS